MSRMKKFSKEQELQICNEYFSKEKSSTYILARKWNCSNTFIWRIIKRNGCVLRISKFTKEEEKQICEEYFSKKKLSTYELAKKWGCYDTTIRSIIIRNGYVLRLQKDTLKDPKVRRKISKARSTPESIQQTLKNGYGTKCYYNNEFFPSLQERDCYIKLINLGYKVIHNFLNRFDFLLNSKIVLEYHSCSWWLEKRSFKQYYEDRRKLLDLYGYKDLKLVVIKNLEEINKLKEIL